MKKEKILSILFGAFFFITSAFFVCIAMLVWLVTMPFDPNRRALHLYASWWGMRYIDWMPGWKIKYEGLDYIDPKKTYVLVANHNSYWDIFVLYGLYKPFKFVSKESIFNIPFIGLNMVLNEYVKIERGDMKSIKAMMAKCKDWLKRGASILLFPEGTRSEDGELQNFRDGAFRLAVDVGVPVIPIVITGTHKILPKDRKYIDFKSDITVRVLPPIFPADFENSSGLMRKHVHQVMQDNYDEMRGRKKITGPKNDSDNASEPKAITSDKSN